MNAHNTQSGTTAQQTAASLNVQPLPAQPMTRDMVAFQRRFLAECVRDDSAARAVLEVAVIWRGKVLSVEQHRKPCPLTLGAGDATATLGAAPAGGWALWLDPQQAGSVLIDPPPQGRRQHTVAQLVEAGIAQPDGDRLRLTLTGGTRARLVFGDTTVLLHQVAAQPLRLPRGRVRSASGVILGLALSVCVYLIFGGLVAYSTERGAQMSITLQDVDMSAQTLRLTTPEERDLPKAPDEQAPVSVIEREPVTSTPQVMPSSKTQARSGQRAGNNNSGGASGPGASGPRGRVALTTVGRNQGALTQLASLGGFEAANGLSRSYDGGSDGVNGGLDAVTSGCFGALCGGGSTGNGTLPSGVPSGKDGDPRLTARDHQLDERPTSAPQAKLTGGDVQTTGMDKQIIKRVINQKKSEITHCYNKELMKNPSLKGRVTMKWRILSSGNVGAVEVVNNELGNNEVASCLKAKIGGWKFPTPKNGAAVDVAYPFNFSSR